MKIQKIVIIDGYNLINSWAELERIKEDSFDEARNELIDRVQEYAWSSKSKIIVVFDAHMRKNNPGKKEKVDQYVQVVFTKEGETADTYIERKVHDLGRRVNISVVTNDSLIQQIATQWGATRKSCIDFKKDLEIAKQKTKEAKEKVELQGKRTFLGDLIDANVLEKIINNKK